LYCFFLNPSASWKNCPNSAIIFCMSSARSPKPAP